MQWLSADSLPPLHVSSMTSNEYRQPRWQATLAQESLQVCILLSLVYRLNLTYNPFGKPSLTEYLNGTLHNLNTNGDAHTDTPPGKYLDDPPFFDLEDSPVNEHSTPDPYLLRKGFMSETELSQIQKSSKGGKRIARYQRKQNEVCRAYVLPVPSMTIIQLIDYLLKPMEKHTEEAQEQEEAVRLPVSHVCGPLITFVTNSSAQRSILPSGLVWLLTLRCVWFKVWYMALGVCTFMRMHSSPFAVYAVISSHSLSILVTGIDSVFDFGSNVVLFWLHRKSSTLDVDKWPVGGARLETIGNIVYGKSWPSS